MTTTLRHEAAPDASRADYTYCWDEDKGAYIVHDREGETVAVCGSEREVYLTVAER